MSFGPILETITFQQLSGPAFLGLYLTSVVAILSAKRLIGNRYLEHLPTTNEQYKLNDYELAYLNAQERVQQVAVTKLNAAGAIGFDTASQPPKLLFKETVPTSNELEAAVLETAKQSGTLADLAKHKSLLEFKQKLESSLVAQSLLLQGSDRIKAFLYNGLFLAPVLLIGQCRWFIGSAAGRPVGFLTFLQVAVGLIWLCHIANTERRTLAGIEHCEKAVNDNASLKICVQAANSQLQVDDIAMAAAVFGVATLGTAYWPAELSATNSSGCGSSCGGGGGCGGGGCGG